MAKKRKIRRKLMVRCLRIERECHGIIAACDAAQSSLSEDCQDLEDVVAALDLLLEDTQAALDDARQDLADCLGQ